jgi:hypothetical protein
MFPSPFDLFGEIPVTQSDIDAWCDRVKFYSPAPWRRDWYIRNWNVPEKIRQAKLSGNWYSAN